MRLRTAAKHWLSCSTGAQDFRGTASWPHLRPRRAVLCDAIRVRSQLYGCSYCHAWLGATGSCHCTSGRDESNALPRGALRHRAYVALRFAREPATIVMGRTLSQSVPFMSLPQLPTKPRRLAGLFLCPEGNRSNRDRGLLPTAEAKVYSPAAIALGPCRRCIAANQANDLRGNQRMACNA
jgi:hypothetical protein